MPFGFSTFPTMAIFFIALRTPSYILEHPNKVVWFLHHHRGAYDLWGTKYQDLPRTPAGAEQRQIIVDADNTALRSAKRLFANSQVVSDRLRRYNRLEAEVLYPPLGDSGGYRCANFDDFVFYPSRLTFIKRQELLVEAMAHVRSDVRLVWLGARMRRRSVSGCCGGLRSLVWVIGWSC